MKILLEKRMESKSKQPYLNQKTIQILLNLPQTDAQRKVLTFG